MSKKVIRVQLNEKSIQEAIQKVREYQKDLVRKNAEFAERLKEYGIEVVNAQMEGIPNPTGSTPIDTGTDTWTYGTEDSDAVSIGKSATATIRVSGNRLLYVEFGYGITYSQPQHPKAGELGYGAGTNSPAGHWNNEKGWWYTESGESHHTYGAPAYAPVWNTALYIRSHKDDIERIAKEVFG